ncbi:hypothetical protein FCH28_12175 [Streptomyces piniterrae]|uniref:Uncharacterized protein n=1 Tax=Streptomyces piniterrae TaxID=2571125 RepID=A0A4U0NNF2_9ACTN|nr:hypothetical protein [Streptomyces piniterrae]TJZ56011.1 hypothetical protein FCH28_12175 [Streptomyces piniterrae]
MRYTVSTRRSAAAGGFCVLLLLALLALLHTGIATDSSLGPDCDRSTCPTHAGAPAASAPAVSVRAPSVRAASVPAVSAAPRRPCAGTDPELTSTGSTKKHPGSGARRIAHASACHLRHHVPTGAGGKAIGDSPAEHTIAAPGDARHWAVVTAPAAEPAQRTVVLRC